MKRSVILILMVAIVGMFSISALAAEGTQERWDEAQNPYYNNDRVSLEGTVELTASGVELKATDGNEYELIYPRFLADGVEITDGDTISVEGYLVPGPRWSWGEDENHLQVDKVSLNGKEYDLASTYASRGEACWGQRNSNYSPQKGGRSPGMMGRW